MVMGSILQVSMNQNRFGNNISDLTSANVVDCIQWGTGNDHQMRHNNLQYVRGLLSWLRDHVNSLDAAVGTRKIEYFSDSIFPPLQSYTQSVYKAVGARSRQRTCSDPKTLYLPQNILSNFN